MSFFKRANGVGDLAQVRYVKARRAAGAPTDAVTHWIATLQYAYTDPSKDTRMRAWNPLGFKIVDFRPEPEVLNEAPSGPALAVTDQAEGSDAMRSAGMIAACCSSLPVFAETQPEPGLLDARIRTAAYSRGSGLSTRRVRRLPDGSRVRDGRDLRRLRRRRHRGAVVRRGRESPVPEAEGREDRHQSHHPHQPPDLPGRLLSERRASRCVRGSDLRAALQLSAGRLRRAGRESARSISPRRRAKNIDYWFCGDALAQAHRGLR